jgi:hypothetical protein
MAANGGRGGERVNTLRIYDVSDVMKYQNAWSWVSAIPAKPGETSRRESERHERTPTVSHFGISFMRRRFRQLATAAPPAAAP